WIQGGPPWANLWVERAPGLDITQQSRERCLAVEEREIAHILAVMLDKVERVEDRLSAASLLRKSSNRDKPCGPSTTASPSIVKLLALMRSAASAIVGSLLV